MPARALIIAIEEYPRIAAGHRQLPGTRKHARAFYDWLISTKKLAEADITFLTDDPVEPRRTGGVTMPDITGAVVALVAAGQDTTPELYVYLSGHGLFYSDRGGRLFADILLAPGFVSEAVSGRECIDLNAVQQELRLSMGPGDHYYFIDACRTEVTSAQIAVSGLGLTLPRSRLGQPDVYSLYSTSMGKAAAAASGFTPHLIEGLRGRGRAKAWAAGKPNTMVVLFERVRDYMKGKLSSQEVDARTDGAGDGHILSLSPAPRFTCRVTVKNGTAGDQFSIAATNQQGQLVRQEAFQGPAHQFEEAPNDYFLTVTHASASVDPVDSPAADLYDDCAVAFIKRPVMPGGVGFSVGGESPADATLDVAGAEGGVEVRDLSTGGVFSTGGGGFGAGGGMFKRTMKPGPYLVKAKDAEGFTVRKERVVLAPGVATAVDLRPLARSPLRAEILAQLPPHAHAPDAVSFSETLGPLTDDEPALWLSILGAARIVGGVNTFSKLKNFQLHSFEDARPGDAPLSVLAGFAEPRGLSVAVSASARHERRGADPVPFMPRVRHAALRPAPGERLLWLHPEGLASLALAIHAIPNRATLVVLAEDDSGAIALRHFNLPVHALAQHPGPRVPPSMPGVPILQTVKFIARAQREFERHRPVRPEAGPPRAMWDGLLAGTWTDPVMTAIAGCELIRRGRLDAVPALVGNLRTHFPGLPDTEGLARLAGLAWELPAAPPLLLECLQAFGSELELPLPRGKLDYRGPWSVWRAAD
jgi:hypothetical protein